VNNTKLGSGISDYKGARKQKEIVQFMLDESKPTVSIIESISEIEQSDKPSFVYVGTIVGSISTLAKSKKSFMTFYNIVSSSDLESGKL